MMSTALTKCIYATVLSTESYLPGVIKLYKSIKKTKSSYPFVCVCSMNITDSTMTCLKEQGIECLQLDRCAIEDISTFNFSKEQEHWKYTFDKLLLFGLTQYKRIVYLDSDMIVLENIDELFSYKSFSAVAAGKLVHPEWDRLNSGILVIEPDVKAMDKMLELIPVVYEKRLEQGQMTGDQDVMNEYKKDWSASAELILPESYNVFFKYLHLYHKKFGFCYHNNDREKSIKVVHFVGRTKPWSDKVVKKLLLVIKFFFSMDYRLNAYLRFLKL